MRCRYLLTVKDSELCPLPSVNSLQLSHITPNNFLVTWDSPDTNLTGLKGFIVAYHRLDKNDQVSRGQFHQHSTSSFYARRSQKCKKSCLTWLFFCAFGIFAGVNAARRVLLKLTADRSKMTLNESWAYCGRRVIESQIIESADNCNQILPILLHLSSAQK